MPVRCQELQMVLVVSIGKPHGEPRAASLWRLLPSLWTMRGCHSLVVLGNGHVEVAEIRLTSSCSRLGRITGRFSMCSGLSQGKHEDSTSAASWIPLGEEDTRM